jgi:hypothetical protein
LQVLQAKLYSWLVFGGEIRRTFFNFKQPIIKMTSEMEALRKLKFNPLKNSHFLSTARIFFRGKIIQPVRVLGILGFNFNF